MNQQNFEPVWADTDGFRTLAGRSLESYPFKHGNCFSLIANGEEFRLVNFFAENFDHLMKTGVLSFPVLIQPISGRHAIITDPRVPQEAISERWCETCCPQDLWPQAQKDAFQAKVDSGEVTIRKFSDMTIISQRINPGPRTINPGWTVQGGN